MVMLLDGSPSEITDANMVVELNEYDSGPAVLTIWSTGRPPIEVVLDEKHVRLIIVLYDVMLDDLSESPMARGWRKYEAIVDLTAARFNDTTLEPDTFCSYASEAHGRIRKAARKLGVRPPLFFERKRGRGIRLTTDRLTIRYRSATKTPARIR